MCRQRYRRHMCHLCHLFWQARGGGETWEHESSVPVICSIRQDGIGAARAVPKSSQKPARSCVAAQLLDHTASSRRQHWSPHPNGFHVVTCRGSILYKRRTSPGKRMLGG